MKKWLFCIGIWLINVGAVIKSNDLIYIKTICLLAIILVVVTCVKEISKL